MMCALLWGMGEYNPDAHSVDWVGLCKLSLGNTGRRKGGVRNRERCS